MADHDPDIARCLAPTAAARLDELVCAVTDRGTSASSRWKALQELRRLVTGDLASRGARWTPYYDAALERARGADAILERHAVAPETIRGFSADDMAPFMVRWSLQQHRELSEMLAGTHCRTLGQVWMRASPAARRLLLGAARDSERAKERVRRFGCAQLLPTVSPRAQAYLAAVAAASAGEIGWGATEEPRAAWDREVAEEVQYNDHDERWHDTINRIAQLGRRENTLHDLIGMLTDRDLEAADNPFR